MTKHNQDGAISGVGISLVISIILLITAIGFGGWAFTERQDYKNNSDQKAAAAAVKAKKEESVRKDAVFAEQIKLPLKTYSGPSSFGSLHVEYPKTWSGYVDTSASGSGGAFVDGYFSPDVVPSVSDRNSAFALRVQVLGKSYADVIKDYPSRQKEGKLSVAAYTLPKMPDIVGVIVTGELTEGKTVTQIVLPLRSGSLLISTDGSQYLEDFNKNILPNFTFSP